MIRQVSKDLVGTLETLVIPRIEGRITQCFSTSMEYPVPSVCPRIPPVTQLCLSKLALLRCVVRDPLAEFRSVEQVTAVDNICGPPMHSVIVMGTGSGKTMSIPIASLHSPGMVFVHIVPFVSLKDEAVKRYAGIPGLRVGVFPEDYVGGGGFRDIGTDNIVIVSSSHVGDESFINALLSLARARRLGRILIDECHLYLVQSRFRDEMLAVGKLSQIDVSLVGLTGTFPPKMEIAYAKRLGIPPAMLNVLRAECTLPLAVRLEKRLVSEGVTRADFIERIITFSRGLLAKLVPGARMLIYVTTHEDCETVADSLGVSYYHGGLPDQEKINRHKQFMSDSASTGAMVCTSAYSHGVHHGYVQYVVLAGAHDVLEVVQAVGRAGRDGKTATAYLFWHGTTYRVADAKDDFSGVNLLGDLFRDDDTCLRYHLTLYANGRGSSCSSIPGATRCAPCQVKLVR